MARPKKPAQLKVVEGSFRKDRDSHGVAVELGLPDCPVWLPKNAKKYWRKIGPELEKVGLIAKVDQAMFAAHCDSVGKYEEVTRMLAELDDMLDETPQGFMVQSAMFTIRNKLWDQVKSSSQEFGLSPSSRSKVKATEQQQLPLGGWDDV
jgi:P27 family predicted phage terminase small subunit